MSDDVEGIELAMDVMEDEEPIPPQDVSTTKAMLVKRYLFFMPLLSLAKEKNTMCKHRESYYH
jgi:hypothetical protein